MGLILRFLSGSLGPWIIIGTLSASGYAGWYAHKVVIKAESVSVLKQEVENRNKEDSHARDVENEVNRLADGAALNELREDWSRN